MVVETVRKVSSPPPDQPAAVPVHLVSTLVLALIPAHHALLALLAPHPGQKSARSAQPESTLLLVQRLAHHVRQVRIWTRQALAVVTRLLLAHSLEVVPPRTLAALRVLTQRTEQVRALFAKQEPS